ncbi:hypothetical protein L0F63_007370 [Massospora cicadina]|nr:hypothetical protein L0F63_007370 [Massospora cicadina]
MPALPASQPQLREKKSLKPLVSSPLSSSSQRSPPEVEKLVKHPSNETERIADVQDADPVKNYRALYDFEGDASYRELSFQEGELIGVIKEHISEGWHLAEKDSKRGLIPVRYVELNRFSWFVSTGVEEFLLGIDDTPLKEPLPETPSTETVEGEDDVERHFIEDGPYWKQKTDIFAISVHDPETKTNLDTHQEYTFTDGPEITVERRFSQFEWLLERLQAKFRALVLPPLPDKQFSGRFSEEFIEKRRRLLERFLYRLARHPILRYSEIFMHFLSCQAETDWAKGDKKFLTERNYNGFAFFQKVFHPEFNVDEDGYVDFDPLAYAPQSDKELVQKFYHHLRSIDKLIPSCQEGIQGFRDHTNEAGNQYRKLSYALLRLISDPDESSPGCLNDEDVWCFKDDCEDCLKLTKAIQEMTERMQSIANTYDTYTTRHFTNSAELLKEYVAVGSSCAPLIEMHSGALKKCQEIAEKGDGEDPIDIELVKSRCDTVFNVALAEINRIHDEKIQDFHTQSIDFLEQQIEFHQKVIADLKLARECLLDPKYSDYSKSPRQFSRYKLEEHGNRPMSRPTSVSSVSSVVGGVVDGKPSAHFHRQIFRFGGLDRLEEFRPGQIGFIAY